MINLELGVYQTQRNLKRLIKVKIHSLIVACRETLFLKKMFYTCSIFIGIKYFRHKIAIFIPKIYRIQNKLTTLFRFFNA
jgi:hypothetical protein